MKVPRGLHHEGRYFADGHVPRLHLPRRAAVGRADVSHHEGAPTGVFEDFAQQRGGSGLAVGAGDGEQQPLGLAIGVLDFTHHVHAQCLGPDHGRVVHRDAGTDDHRVHALHQVLGVLFPKAQHRPRGLDIIQRAVEIRLGFAVAGPHLRALLQQKLRRGDAAARHTEDEHLFVFHHTDCPPVDRRGADTAPARYESLRTTRRAAHRRPCIVHLHIIYPHHATKPSSAIRHSTAVTM